MQIVKIKNLSMASDLFERIKVDKGPLGKWADKAEGYYVFPKLEGPISNRMSFNGKIGRASCRERV